MERRQQNRAEFFLHAFTIGVFILFVVASLGKNSDSDFNADSSSLVSEISIEYDALPAGPPVVPDFDEHRLISENHEFFGINNHLSTILVANRMCELEFQQLVISFQEIQPTLAFIAFMSKDFSSRAEIYPAIS